MTDGPTRVEQEKVIHAWIEQAGLILALGIPAANIKWALERWAEEADRLYPLVDEGEPVSLTESAIDGALAAVPQDLRQQFLATTVFAFFEGEDGPRAAANVLSGAVDLLDKDIERQENESGKEEERGNDTPPNGA